MALPRYSTHGHRRMVAFGRWSLIADRPRMDSRFKCEMSPLASSRFNLARSISLIRETGNLASGESGGREVSVQATLSPSRSYGPLRSKPSAANPWPPNPQTPPSARGLVCACASGEILDDDTAVE